MLVSRPPADSWGVGLRAINVFDVIEHLSTVERMRVAVITANANLIGLESPNLSLCLLIQRYPGAEVPLQTPDGSVLPNAEGERTMRQTRVTNRPFPLLVGILTVVLCAGWTVLAGAQVVLDSPELPPEPDPPDCDRVTSIYAGIGVHAVFPGPIDMSDPIHYCFQNVVREDDGNGNEIETFDSKLEAQVDIGGGPMPITLTGPVQTVVYGKIGNETGTFDTEIIAMSLTGDAGGIPVEIRESPSLPSQGMTIIEMLPAGDFLIDSFFDVFTELSVNGGPFQPQINEAGHMILIPNDEIAVEKATWGDLKTDFR